MKKARWDVIADKLPKDRPIVGAEIGVYRGKLAYNLLQLLPNLTLHMVDRWSVYTEGEQNGDISAHMTKLDSEQWPMIEAAATAIARKFKKRAIIRKGCSREIAKEFDDNSLDFVFIDADHSYEGCKGDILAWMPKVKPGGWVMGHDYPMRDGVRRAVDELFDDVAPLQSRCFAVQV